MMDLIKLYEEIKKSFCGLNSYKMRGEVIEIITPFSTLNDKFVSVFIKQQKAGLVVTDGGWIDNNTYENPTYDTSEDIVNKVIQHNQNNYGIKTTSDPEGILFYYKLCTDPSQIASTVFDLSNFVVSVVNSFCIQFKDEKEFVLQVLKLNTDMAIEEEKIHSWIPIEKAKPKPLQRVYVVCENCKYNGYVARFQTIAEYIPYMTVKEEDYIAEIYQGIGDYNEEEDEYYTPEGFYEWQSEPGIHWKMCAKITHWMPLLELP